MEWVQSKIEWIVGILTTIGGLVFGAQAQKRLSRDTERDNDREDFGAVVHALQSQNDALTTRVTKLENRQDTQQDEIIRLTQQVLKLTKERNALQLKVQKMEAREDGFRDQIADLRKSVDRKDQRIEQLNARIRTLEDRSQPTMET